MNKNYDNGYKFPDTRLTVIETLADKKCGKVMVRCKCDCGNVKDIREWDIIHGKTKSCGCINKELTSKRSLIHGYNRTKVYYCWQNMISRCCNKNAKDYLNYGGRGICVCEQWHNAENFIMWALKNGYKDGLTIDRIDNNGNYEPSNCRWITHKEQMKNTSRNRRYDFDGKSLLLQEWAELTGINRDTLWGRIRNGWAVDRVFTEPLNKSKSRSKTSENAKVCNIGQIAVVK